MYSVASIFSCSALTLRAVVFLTIIMVTTLLPMIAPAPIRAATDCSPDGIRYAGGNWLSGSGVNVCNFGGGGSNYAQNVNGVSTLTGYKWQCVEMVNRLYLLRGWITAFWQGNGNTLINNIPAGLTKQNNGSLSYINPGDVITMDDESNGHAAVVNSITVSGGTTTINIINQNSLEIGSSAAMISGSLANGNAKLEMNGWERYEVQAIIHRPSGGSGDGGSGGGSIAWTPGVAREDGAGLHWYLRSSNSGGSADTDFIYGRSADKPVVGDWNGNGSTTAGVVRKDGAGWHWYLRNSNSGGSANHDFIYGLSSTDIPVVGDWDDNGTVTAGLVRRDGAGWRWYLRNSHSGGAANIEFPFGVYATDRPITGDWDGSGSTTIGVYRQDGNNWRWYIRNSNSSGAATDFLYGVAATDKPVAGDWDGNRSATPGVLRSDGGGLHWYLRNSNNSGAAHADFIYGLSADDGITGNWN